MPRTNRMRKGCKWGWTQFALILVVAVLAGRDQAAAGIAAPVAVIGPKRMLVVAVRFPGTVPAFSLPQVMEKVEKWTDIFVPPRTVRCGWNRNWLAGMRCPPL